MDKVERLFFVIYEYGYCRHIAGPFSYEEAIEEYTDAVQNGGDVKIAKITFLDCSNAI